MHQDMGQPQDNRTGADAGTGLKDHALPDFRQGSRAQSWRAVPSFDASRDSAEVAETRLKAASGDAAAMMKMAQLYIRGNGVAPDVEEAARWLHLGAMQGDSNCLYEFGMALVSGGLGEVHTEEATHYLEESASLGNPKAAYNLSLIYDSKNSACWDPERAAKHLLAAAEQGLPEALWRLGNSYVDGEHGVKDPEKGAQCMLRAAESGLPKAQYRMGDLYRTGCGVPQDKEKASEWLTRGAANQDGGAMLMLGELYLEGFGGRRADVFRGLECFLRAAELGWPGAFKVLGSLYTNGMMLPKNPAMGAMFGLCAHPAVLNVRVGAGAQNGESVTRADLLRTARVDLSQVYAMVLDGAMGGDAAMQRMMANHLNSPDSSDKDRALGRSLLKSLASEGDKDAIEDLERLAQKAA